MNAPKVRVRFAPAPTGMMHLGNIRTALMNYLFAYKKNGVFVLRIEDTDAQRNIDPDAHKIKDDLTWLGLIPHEGPDIGGSYGPYFQSQRTSLYAEYKNKLADKKKIYRCFCSAEELEKKKKHQELLRIPPRYDRTCLRLNEDTIEKLLTTDTPFIWRFKIDHEQIIKVHDIAHGTTVFELKNFSDFAITRQDGSYTFLFANFVDDLTMNISHVFRGEDHKSNTANQAALYATFNHPLPLFWHLPILCSIDGKKLSKRDFGFSLRDLKDAGFLPQAIGNYLGIIGGSFKHEIMSLDELARTINLENPSVTGQIKYDLEKLKWINHKWIALLKPTELAQACRPFLLPHYRHEIEIIDDTQLGHLLSLIQTDLITLADSVTALSFFFKKPSLTTAHLSTHLLPSSFAPLFNSITTHMAAIATPSLFINNIKKDLQTHAIDLKQLFHFLRLALTGNPNGPAINNIIEMLGIHETETRITSALHLLSTIK